MLCVPQVVASAYPASADTVTQHHRDHQLTVDYVLYTCAALEAVAHWSLPSRRALELMPNASAPSDHLLLMARFRLL